MMWISIDPKPNSLPIRTQIKHTYSYLCDTYKISLWSFCFREGESINVISKEATAEFVIMSMVQFRTTQAYALSLSSEFYMKFNFLKMFEFSSKKS